MPFARALKFVTLAKVRVSRGLSSLYCITPHQLFVSFCERITLLRGRPRHRGTKDYYLPDTASIIKRCEPCPPATH